MQKQGQVSLIARWSFSQDLFEAPVAPDNVRHHLFRVQGPARGKVASSMAITQQRHERTSEFLWDFDPNCNRHAPTIVISGSLLNDTPGMANFILSAPGPADRVSGPPENRTNKMNTDMPEHHAQKVVFVLRER